MKKVRPLFVAATKATSMPRFFSRKIDNSNQDEPVIIIMALSLNCKEAGDPVCTQTMYGETEEEILANIKKHGIEVHGYTSG